MSRCRHTFILLIFIIIIILTLDHASLDGYYVSINLIKKKLSLPRLYRISWKKRSRRGRRRRWRRRRTSLSRSASTTPKFRVATRPSSRSSITWALKLPGSCAVRVFVVLFALFFVFLLFVWVFTLFCCCCCLLLLSSCSLLAFFHFIFMQKDKK